jgi:hypothetical protein
LLFIFNSGTLNHTLLLLGVEFTFSPNLLFFVYNCGISFLSIFFGKEAKRMNSFLWSRHFPWYVPLVFGLSILGCNQVPKAARGSPEYSYSEAKRAVAEVKYEKAISLAGDVQTKFPDSDYAGKARILRIVLFAGLSEGYKNIADAYISGFEKSIRNPGLLRSTAFDYYRKQKTEALGLYETASYFLKNFSEKTSYDLDCEFPKKDVTDNTRLNEIRQGNILDSDQRRVAEEDELQNGVIRSLAAFVGASGDRAKARKLLASGPRPLDHAEFLVILGRTFMDNQKLFGRSALNDTQNFRQFYQKASECTNLALKILKQKPNKGLQIQADQLEAEIKALEKKGTTIS